LRPPFTGPPGLVLVVLDRSFPALSRAVVFDGSCPRPLVALWSSARTARLALSNAPGCTRRRTRHGRRLSRSSSTAEGSTPCPSRTRSWAPAVNHDLCRGGPNNASQLRPRARSLVVDHQVSVRTTGSAPRQASYGRGVSLTAPDGEGAATFLVRCVVTIEIATDLHDRPVVKLELSTHPHGVRAGEVDIAKALVIFVFRSTK
jgi:hypothetical protein